jgi:hypothetical protein
MFTLVPNPNTTETKAVNRSHFSTCAKGVNTTLLGACCRIKHEESPSNLTKVVHLTVTRILLATADNYSILHLPRDTLALFPITRIHLVARQGCYEWL